MSKTNLSKFKRVRSTSRSPAINRKKRKDETGEKSTKNNNNKKQQSLPKSINNKNKQNRLQNKTEKNEVTLPEIISTENDEEIKYTKFEKQVLELKSKHPGMLLLIESGYKHKFMGDDAKTASMILNIQANKVHNLYQASIPSHRLNVHVKRLVDKGYKIGIIKQSETTALKKCSSNKSDLFARELSAIYTKSTLIGEDVDTMVENVHSMACIMEIEQENKACQIGIIILEPSTGELIYDNFIDKDNRLELDKRLCHTRPVEVILPQTISSLTEKLLSDKKIRIEKIPYSWYDYSNANCLKDYNTQSTSPCILGTFVALNRYLTDFQLNNVINFNRLQRFYVPNKYLQLDAGTVKNLELFEANGKYYGSFCWILDCTKTDFGRRLLKKWISKPLCVLDPLIERQEAISELMKPDVNDFLSQIREFLSKFPDLEKDLTSVFHKKIKPCTFANLIISLYELFIFISEKEMEIWTLFSNPYIENLIQEIRENLHDIQKFKNNLNIEAAKANNKVELLNDWSEFPSVIEHKKAVITTRKKLENLRPILGRQIGILAVDYVTVAGLEYLIEVKKNDKNIKIPNDWEKISSLQKVERYRPKEVRELYGELCQCKERLTAECNLTWIKILENFSKYYDSIKIAISNLAILDVLISLAIVSKREGYCKPILGDGEPCINIKQGCHPLFKQIFNTTQEVVSNDTTLGKEHEISMIISGPNMGGKSSYIRQVGMLVIMAQIGCYIPAESAEINLVDAIFTRMGAKDEIHLGRSTFLIELDETALALKQATNKSLVILDELGRGTSTHDGAAIAIATLKYLITQIRCFTLFVTHFPLVMSLQDQFPKLVKNYHVGFGIHESNDSSSVIFLYALKTGKCEKSFGVNVARLARLPEDIIKLASAQSQKFQDHYMNIRTRINQFRILMLNSDPNKLRSIIQDLKLK